jgi:hypothetical protein
LHRDPFDRIPVAQAIVEPAPLYTADQQFVPYSDLVRRIGGGQPKRLRAPHRFEAAARRRQARIFSASAAKFEARDLARDDLALLLAEPGTEGYRRV